MQVAVEGLPHAGHVAPLDQRLRDVRPAHGRLAGDLQHPLPAQRHPQFRQLGQHRAPPRRAALAVRRQLRLQARLLDRCEVAQDVRVAAVGQVGAQFDAGDHPHADRRARAHGLGDAGGRVVVGQRDVAHAVRGRAADQFVRRQDSIRVPAVCVEVADCQLDRVAS